MACLTYLFTGAAVLFLKRCFGTPLERESYSSSFWRIVLFLSTIGSIVYPKSSHQEFSVLSAMSLPEFIALLTLGVHCTDACHILLFHPRCSLPSARASTAAASSPAGRPCSPSSRYTRAAVHCGHQCGARAHCDGARGVSVSHAACEG